MLQMPCSSKNDSEDAEEKCGGYSSCSDVSMRIISNAMELYYLQNFSFKSFFLMTSPTSETNYLFCF
jgi:hypothetical protein